MSADVKSQLNDSQFLEHVAARFFHGYDYDRLLAIAASLRERIVPTPGPDTILFGRPMVYWQTLEQWRDSNKPIIDAAFEMLYKEHERILKSIKDQLSVIHRD